MKYIKFLKQRTTVRQWRKKQVSQRHINYIQKCIEYIPVNQNEVSYNITFVTNKDIINDIYYNYSYCVTQNGKTKVAQPIPLDIDKRYVTFNGQMSAPLLILASIDRDSPYNISQNENNVFFTMGMMMNAIAECKLDSGMCNCLDRKNIASLIGLPDNYETILGVGVGYKDGVNRLDSVKSKFDNFFNMVKDENGKTIGKTKINHVSGQSLDHYENPIDKSKLTRFID